MHAEVPGVETDGTEQVCEEELLNHSISVSASMAGRHTGRCAGTMSNSSVCVWTGAKDYAQGSADCPWLLGKEQLLCIEVGMGQTGMPTESQNAQRRDSVGQLDTSTWPGHSAQLFAQMPVSLLL